ncbi:hypothetical protein ABT026_12420 [Streptomyces sp. NPDC002734]|uniref:hypothetical protein n=1 Tax=Streptomyces sp. NPDC002734 TaxID=3154426 RepID=UPI0033224CEB
MRVTEVGAALTDMTELRRFQADPWSPGVLGVEFGADRGRPAVYAYFIDERMYCAAVDAASGPQVTLWGRRLTACVPDDVERFLAHAQGCGALGLSYGPRGNPGSNDVGLVLRLQEIAGRAVTRPVVVGSGWADRCTDDYEGAIPECEWVGRQWRSWEGSVYFPWPGHETNWGDWQPPVRRTDHRT